MRLSPLDVRQQRFTVRAFRGLDPREVDAFLDDVAADYEAVLKENALLKEQLAALEERQRAHAELERTLRDALVSAQRTADDLKQNARHEADLIVREAELRGEKLLEDARAEEGKVRAQILQLRRMRRHLAENVKAAIDTYQRLVDTDLADAGE
jgi:cell division initiation protein